MKASEAKLLEILRKSPQFVIPIYQRTYSWTPKECQQLWDDILRAGGSEAITGHFIGSVVYVEKGLYSIAAQSPLLVIDGQQRLTTVTLLIAALAEVIGEGEPPLEDFTPRKLRNYYLLNPEEEGERHYKLILSQTDKASLIALLQQGPRPERPSLRIEENYRHFVDLLMANTERLAQVCQGIAKLMVVDVSLDREQDNPQLIFESMNSTGRELTQADLIRNYILMGLEPELQTRLYNLFWYPMEQAFGQEAYTTHFDAFMRHWLTVRSGEIPRMSEVYTAFKAYQRAPQVSGAGVEALVADLHAHAGYYCAMALGKEPDHELARAFHDLRELKVDVAYPLLLELYHDYASGQLSQVEMLTAVRLIESYVFRRAICALPTNSMNKSFAQMGRALDKAHYLESLQAAFMLLPSYRRFPRDEEFMREFKQKDIYNFRSRSYWLRRLENDDRKERVSVDEYTIEHILPQCDNNPLKVPEAWHQELGDAWERDWEALRHTLGNLTLTAYNSEMSNRSFAEKCAHEGGFAHSPLRLNQGIAKETRWDAEAIRRRAERLARRAIEVWRLPHLTPAQLEAYRPSLRKEGGDYSLEGHRYMDRPHVRALFEAFRQAVLALDPVVTEEILKLYIAFKAETNFVDVEPQARRLRLTLNMPFPDIDDPKGICLDFTQTRGWGNGDIKLYLSELDELPYALGLVRQALERQMGAGSE